MYRVGTINISILQMVKWLPGVKSLKLSDLLRVIQLLSGGAKI